MARTVKTVEVTKKVPTVVEIKDVLSLVGTDSLIVTSSGPFKLMHKRDNNLIDVVFLKEGARELFSVALGDILIFDNHSYQTVLDIYLIQWS